MVVEDSKKVAKKNKKFICSVCDYNTSNKNDYSKHLSTLKHKNGDNGIEMVVNGIEKIAKIAKPYICQCGKEYLYDSGYYRHKQKCLINNVKTYEAAPQNTLYDKDMMLMLIKQNAELLEIVKNGTNNITNSNNNNNNNKTFNLQVFLNETCKNAMNMSEFIETIKIQLPDLEKMGEIGYVQGLSNIINNNLKTLDITQRPVHCTDQKRETIYIKNDNIWEKEDDNKTKLRKAINKIAVKNIKALPQFREKYPDYNNSSLKISDTYDKLVLEAMGGVGDEILKESKIIHNISKCITIDSSIKHSLNN
jgi:hypothetical protein